MDMSDSEQMCETCRFWLADPFAKDHSDDSDNPGVCRRFPPVFVATPKDDIVDESVPRICHSFIFWNQPITQGYSDWCGEWTAKDTSARPES